MPVAQSIYGALAQLLCLCVPKRSQGVAHVPTVVFRPRGGVVRQSVQAGSPAASSIAPCGQARAVS
eukprot:6250422-Pyramimonas_sp.AAC.1